MTGVKGGPLGKAACKSPCKSQESLEARTLSSLWKLFATSTLPQERERKSGMRQTWTQPLGQEGNVHVRCIVLHTARKREREKEKKKRNANRQTQGDFCRAHLFSFFFLLLSPLPSMQCREGKARHTSEVLFVPHLLFLSFIFLSLLSFFRFLFLSRHHRHFWLLRSITSSSLLWPTRDSLLSTQTSRTKTTHPRETKERKNTQRSPKQTGA